MNLTYEIESNIKEAIDLYIEELQMYKKPIPLPQSQAINLAV
jgi:predicted RNase H-like HicB family nuclease